MPTTTAGKWSLGLIVFAVIAFLIMDSIIYFFGAWLADIPGTAACILRLIRAAVLLAPFPALVTGLASVIKEKERSVLVFSSIAASIAYFVFAIADEPAVIMFLHAAQC